MNDIVLKKSNGETFTTSLLIAEKFGKQHKNVIRAIEKLPNDEFWRLNFEPRDYEDERGKWQPMYEINRDGFSLLAMRFTGKKAYEWQIKFIGAFNKMERHLKNMLNKNWIEHRAEASLEYKAMSRTLQEVRKLEGKDTKFFHYTNEAKLVNWALTGEFKKVDRNALNNSEIEILVTLETYNAVLLGAGHDRNSRKLLLKNRFNEITLKKLPHVTVAKVNLRNSI